MMWVLGKTKIKNVFNQGSISKFYLLNLLREDIFVDNDTNYVNNKAAEYNKDKDNAE